MRKLLWFFAIACSGSGGAREPTPDDRGCRQEAAARTACEARGSGYQYTYAPRSCGGARVDQDMVRERAATTPCECVENGELARLRQECAEAP